MNRLAVLANERHTKNYVFGEGVNGVLGVQSVSKETVTVIVDRVVGGKTTIDIVEVPHKYVENPETAYREVCADETIQDFQNSYLMDMEERKYNGLKELSLKEWAAKQSMPLCVRHEAQYLDTGEIISLSGDDCGECIGYDW